MNLVGHLRHHLVSAGLVSASEESALTIAVSIGDTPRHPSRLTRRYVVSRPDGSTFSVKFIPQPWAFDVAHIVKTQAQYARCTSFRVPRLTARFPVSEGCFFVEENLGPAPTLAQLVELRTVSVDAAAAVIRSILGEIWQSGRKPTEAFVRQEKLRYRGYLLRFVEAGLLADVTADGLDRLVDEHRSALRRVWSSGDIIDKNILRVGDSWVLVDFEYAHETLFFFKEAFRSILNSAWARELPLASVCSFLGEFPEPAARLLSLLWERQLYALVLDTQADAVAHTSLRDRFWQVLDAELVVRNDQRLSALRQERQRLHDTLHTQHEQLLRHTADVEQLHAEAQQLREENLHLRQGATEGTEHTRRLEGEVNRLQIERDNLQADAQTLAAECDRLQIEGDSLRTHAAALAAERDRLQTERDTLQTHAHTLAAERDRLQTERDNLQTLAHALAAERDRLQTESDNLQTLAHTLAAERDRLQTESDNLQTLAHTLAAERDRLQGERDNLQTHAHTLAAERGQLQSERGNLQTHAHTLAAERDRLQSERDTIQTHAHTLAAERDQLHSERDTLQTHAHTLAAERDQLHSERDTLQAHARTLAAELDQLREADQRAQAFEVEIAQLRSAQANADARARALEAQISRQLIHQSNLQTHAHDLGAEVVSLRSNAREASNQVHALEVVVESQRSTLERATNAVRAAQEATSTRDAANAELATEATALRSQVEDLQSQLATRDADLVYERQAVHDSTCSLVEREQTLSMVFNSWSWRLTRPLRWVFDHLRGDGGPSPKQLVTGVASSAEQRASQVRYHVEAFHIEVGDQPGTSVVRLHGWCFAPLGREPVVLEVRSEERTLQRIVCDLGRDDVAAAHPEEAATSSLPRCGFDATIAVEQGCTRLVLWSPAYATTLATLAMDRAAGAPPPDVHSVHADRTLEYHVEKFRTVANPFHNSEFLEISGWCFSTERRTPVRLELRADGHPLLEWRCDHERPDVTAGFHSVVAAATSSLPLCGFDEVLPLVGVLPNGFELVSPDDGIVLANGSAEQLATLEPAVAGDAAFASPVVADWLDTGPPSFGDWLRRVHTRARAKVTWRAALSPVKWQQWLQRTLQEYRLQRVEWQMAGAAGGLGGRGARAATIQPNASIERAARAGRPVKIACFTHNLNFEGATKVMLDAALGLTFRERFHAFVASPFDGPARPRLESQGIKCHIVPLPGTESLITGWRRAADYEQSVRIVRAFLAAEKPDAVMATVLNNFYVIEACAYLGIPSLWLIQESYPHATMLRSVNAFALPNLQRAFSLAHAVVFGSRGTRELYERHNTQQNFQVIYNALRPDELEMLRNGPSVAEARRRLGIPAGRRVILSVGTVCKRKDQATLARALGLLAQRRDDFHAYLVGAREGDPYVRVVEQLIRKSPARGHVEVIRETHDVHAYYRAADIFAFSSLSESYPLVILEAMAHGLPIVTTNCTGVSEQVQFGANALGFQFTDAEGLANHLDALLSDDEQRSHMAQRSREIFASLLTYDEMIHEYEALLQSALQPSQLAEGVSAAALR